VKQGLSSLDADFKLHQYDLLNTAQEKTGQPRIYIVLAVVILSFILITAVFGLSFISNLFGFYPLYASFRSLRNPQPTDDQFWLTYWIVFAALSLFESLFDGAASWLPIYYIIKIVFLVWCFHPASKGAFVLYQRLLGPLLVGTGASSSTTTTTTTTTSSSNNNTQVEGRPNTGSRSSKKA